MIVFRTRTGRWRSGFIDWPGGNTARLASGTSAERPGLGVEFATELDRTVSRIASIRTDGLSTSSGSDGFASADFPILSIIMCGFILGPGPGRGPCPSASRVTGVALSN